MSATTLNTAKRWRGYFETFEEVDAETEEEAVKKLTEKIVAVLTLEEPAAISCWEVTPR